MLLSLDLALHSIDRAQLLPLHARAAHNTFAVDQVVMPKRMKPAELAPTGRVTHKDAFGGDAKSAASVHPDHQAQRTSATPLLKSNSLGFSCNQSDYPGKSFRRGRVVQIHIPKTGGTSLEHWSYRSGYRFAHQHMMPFQRNDPPESFRFAFVRNPYTRFVSQYTFCKQGPHATWNNGFPCHLVAKYNMSFDDWWMHLWSTALRIGNGTLPSMHDVHRPQATDGMFDRFGRPTSPGKLDYRPAPRFWCSGDSKRPVWWGNCYGPVSQWVYQNGRSGKLAVDWVGRLEDINSDFACLRQLLTDASSRAPAQLKIARPSLRNSSTRKHSVAGFLQNATIAQLVRDNYADDFINFGYSLEVPTPGQSDRYAHRTAPTAHAASPVRALV